MTRRAVSALLGVFLLVSIPTAARAEKYMISGEQEDEPTDYEIRPGDTLWDLCDDFYADSYFWPRVWARNPQITNPHWIYPGDILRFPKLEEFEQEDSDRVAAEEESAKPGDQKDAKKRAPEVAPPSPGGARIRFVPRAWEEQYFVRMVGFLTEREIEESGTIQYSREERLVLAELDEVYVDFRRLPRVRPGDRWSIVVAGPEISHPIFGNVIGRRIDILGVLEITAVDSYVARGIIIRAYQEVERGALVSPLIPNFRSVKPRPNKRDVDAYIIDAHTEMQALASQDVVFIDRGTRDGVEVGNRFVVFRRGDGYVELEQSETEKLPWEPIAEIMVIETKDRYSTGLIINSVSETEVGDFCRMRQFF